jgi:GTP-binding protein EngB required for normal cell division
MKTSPESRLMELSEALQEIAKDEGHLSESIGSAVERLKKKEFNLVLLGQFKRGKSTLANCFIRKGILPSGVLPLTSIITEIRYGRKEALHVCYASGKRRTFPLDTISSFVTEKLNPGNKKGVDKVIVFSDSAFLKNGVVLIDTPGTSSTLTHNTKVTEDYLPNCDAAIMLISADSPLSSEEVGFIKAIQRYAPRVFFVLNKCDYVSEKDKRDMARHVECELRKSGIASKVMPVSARVGLLGRLKKDGKLVAESGIQRLEKVLLNFLSRSKGFALLEAARLRLNSIALSLFNQLQSEYAAVSMSVQDISAKAEEFDRQFELIKHSALSYSGSIDSEFDDLMREIDEDMKAAKESLTRAVVREVGEALQQKQPDKTGFVEYANSIIDAHVQSRLTAWRKAEDNKICARLEAIEKRYAYLLSDTARRLKNASSHIFKFQLKQVSPKYKMGAETGFYFKPSGFGRDTLMMPSLFDILPSSLKRKRIMAKLDETIGADTEANLGRIRYDYLQRLNAGKENFKETLLAVLEGTKKEIEAGLRKGKPLATRTFEEKVLIKKDLRKKLDKLTEIIEATGRPL